MIFVINKRAQARKHGQSKRIRREKGKDSMRETITAQREAGSAHYNPKLLLFWQWFHFSVLSVPITVKSVLFSRFLRLISISISVRAVRLIFAIVFIKWCDLVLSNRINFVQFWSSKPELNINTSKQTTKNSSQIFIPSFIANETLVNLVTRLLLVIRIKQAAQRSEHAKLNPQFSQQRTT